MEIRGLRNLIEINLPTLTRFELVIKIFMEILFWSQSLGQQVPEGYKPQRHGKVRKTLILGGLCNHYDRIAA